MSKRQKLSFFYFEGLPDEIILKIFSLLDIKGVLQCGQVSKRLRDISNDRCLWSKLNLSGRRVPYGFIEKAAKNGCEYLNLGLSFVHGEGIEKAGYPWKLKYLEMSQSSDEWDECAQEVPEGVLQNCHSLQKLAVDNLTLYSRDIEQICQNGKTLRVLSLEGCNIEFDVHTELFQKLFTTCSQLTELNIYNCNYTLLDGHICALVDNLAPNILKLSLGSQKCIEDDHVNTLVQRCNKITELDLSGTSITNDSIESIVKHLNSLEKLDVQFRAEKFERETKYHWDFFYKRNETKIDVSSILQLKSIPTLKILHCFYGYIYHYGRDQEKENTEKINNLKLQLPHISINEERLNIASSTKEVNGSIDPDLFWEIRAKEQKPFFLKLEST